MEPAAAMRAATEARCRSSNDNDAIWAACLSANMVLATGAGYTKGADNGGGDIAEYNVTTDPAGTVQDVLLVNGAAFRINAIAIKPD